MCQCYSSYSVDGVCILCVGLLIGDLCVSPAAFRNLGQNLWGPHRYGCLSEVQVSCVVSGPCAAHSLLITSEGRLWSWGEWMFSGFLCRTEFRVERVVELLLLLLQVVMTKVSWVTGTRSVWKLPS